MPTIEQLGAGIGDKVRFSSREHRHLPAIIAEAFQEPPMVEVEAEIVALDERAVYLHPWTEKLAVFTRVQNMQTGGISAVRATIVNGAVEELPLEEGERYVLALDRNADIFSRVASL